MKIGKINKYIQCPSILKLLYTVSKSSENVLVNMKKLEMHKLCFILKNPKLFKIISVFSGHIYYKYRAKSTNKHSLGSICDKGKVEVCGSICQ